MSFPQIYRAISIGGLIVLICGKLSSTFAQEVPPTNVASNMPASGAIQVTVNGENVPFPGQGPVQQGATILVPLRGVFEKLGATVKYDALKKAITAVKGPTTVSLRLGATSANVNGKNRALSVPASVVGGATLVPLRFVSEALGAQVRWNAADRLVEVVTEAVVAERLPTIPAQITSVIGTLTGVFLESDAITVRVRNGENRRLTLAPGAFVQMKAAGQPAKSSSLNALRVGDQVTVERDSDGNAKVIVLVTDERVGYVKAFEPLANGNVLVRLTNGTSVELLGSAPITMAGRRVTLREIKPGERMVIKVQPETLIGISAAVATGDDPMPTPPDPETADPVDAPPEGFVLPEEKPNVNVKPSATETVASDPEMSAPATTGTTKPSENTPTEKTTQPPEEPAPKPDPEPVKPEVKEVILEGAEKILKGGETVIVTVVGTAGADGKVSAPKLFEGIALPLKEKDDKPGTYSTTFNIPYNLTVADVVVSATLQIGETVSAMKEAAQKIRTDANPPTISDVEPQNEATVEDIRPQIQATFAEKETRINPKQVKVYVNNADVSEKAVIGESGFSYRPPEDFAPGLVRVTVVAADAVGNEARQNWKFTIKPPVKPIRSITVTPANTVLRANDVVSVRLEGAPGGDAWFRLDTQDDIKMKELDSGVYTGTYLVKKGDNVRNARVYVRFQPRGSEDKILREAEDTVTLRAVPPEPATIESPKDNDTTEKTVVFRGKAEPGSTVKLTFKFEGKRFLARASGTLNPVEVKTGADGIWQTEPISLEVKNLSSLIFTVTATAAFGEETSPPVSVRFRRK